MSRLYVLLPLSSDKGCIQKGIDNNNQGKAQDFTFFLMWQKDSDTMIL